MQESARECPPPCLRMTGSQNARRLLTLEQRAAQTPTTIQPQIPKHDYPDFIVYHDIPCIAPENEGLDFFLPWSNLPRHLAARMVYLAGWPSLCAPIVQDDRVVIQFGPASWDDGQWALLENALIDDAIDVKKTSSELAPSSRTNLLLFERR
jgi:hypothetical protein